MHFTESLRLANPPTHDNLATTNLSFINLTKSKLTTNHGAMNPFVDRRVEVDAFRRRWARHSSFALVYGQRRVGKTFLLQQLAATEPDALYFIADETTGAALLARFHGEVASAGRGGALWAHTRPTDWSTALSLLVQAAHLEGRRLLLVLDEFQYLLAAAPELPSVLQRIWDESHRRVQLHLVVCGSALGVLSTLGEEKQPLHGRFDLRLALAPFGFREVAEFAPGWSTVEKLRLFGVFGHLARTLAAVDPARTLGENVCEALLDPLSALHDAPLDMLRCEHLSSLGDASAVLAALAHGENRFNQIAARTGLTASRLDHVLRELMALEIVRKEIRFGDAPGSKNSAYRVADPFTTFWYRHVHANRSALRSQGVQALYAERIEPRLDDLMGPVFEEVTRQAVARGVLAETLGPVDELASYWSRDGQTQIDLVVRSGASLAVVECKWRPRSAITVDDLRRLQAHAARAFPKAAPPKCALVTAGSIDAGLKRVAREEGVVLVDAAGLFRFSGSVLPTASSL